MAGGDTLLPIPNSTILNLDGLGSGGSVTLNSTVDSKKPGKPIDNSVAGAAVRCWTPNLTKLGRRPTEEEKSLEENAEEQDVVAKDDTIGEDQMEDKDVGDDQDEQDGEHAPSSSSSVSSSVASGVVTTIEELQVTSSPIMRSKLALLRPIQ